MSKPIIKFTNKCLSLVLCFIMIFSLTIPAINSVSAQETEQTSDSIVHSVTSINYYNADENIFRQNTVSVIFGKSAEERVADGQFPIGADYKWHTAFVLECIGAQNNSRYEFIVDSVVAGENIKKDHLLPKTDQGFVLYILDDILNESNTPKRGDLVMSDSWIAQDKFIESPGEYNGNNYGHLTFIDNPSADETISTAAADENHSRVKIFNYDSSIIGQGSDIGFWQGDWGLGGSYESVDGEGQEYNFDLKNQHYKMSDTLDSQGYPITESGKSFAYLFDGSSTRSDGSSTLRGSMNNGGGLFRERNGYYYYDSLYNAAYYNETLNKFEIYDNLIVRPWYDTSDLSKEAYGNFLPFNKISSDNILIDNKLTYTDEALSSNVVGSQQPPEHTFKDIGNEKNVTTARHEDKVDLWFGMTVEDEFIQPVSGLVNDKEMSFEFLGDDDVLVYIGLWNEAENAYDYRLTLDIGGVHGARHGKINFATGEVEDFPDTLDGVTKNEAPRTRTLKEIFDLEGNTFEDYSKLSLKFFYLERGGNISYCGLGFNIPSLPQNSLTVTKEIESDVKVFENAAPAKFRIVKADSEGNATDEPLVTSGTYDIIENDTVVGVGNLSGKGIFTLLPGQSARFSDMLTKTDFGYNNYVVQEIIGTDIAAQYTGVTCIVGGSKPVELSSSASEDGVLYNSTALSGEETESVTFINEINSSVAGVLSVSKNAVSGTDIPADRIFDINVTIGGKPLPAGAEYYLNYDTSKVYAVNNAGIIPLKVGETATLVNKLLAGTAFEVKEAKTVGYAPEYSGSITTVLGTENLNITLSGANGVMPVGGAASVVVSNSIDTSGITTDKYVDEADTDDKFVLTLESFSQGETLILPKDEPMDIVLVLDQSGSMHAPAGVTENLYNTKLYTDIPNPMQISEIDTEKAKYQGYYIAQSRSGRPIRDAAGNIIKHEYDWFIVWYKDGYWYYVRNANHYTPVVFDLNGSADTLQIGATLKRTVPYDTFNYYKTQFGALHDAMLEFIDDVKATGVNHKIAITGFSSPFYDGYPNYNGSGLYLDGDYYLFDTQFLNADGSITDSGLPDAEDVYDRALVDISTEEGYQSIVSSAKAVISNYWHTCPAAGLHMANEIFRRTYNQTDSLNGAKPERERMIILFTDGYPTTATGADQFNRYNSDRNLYWEDEANGIYPGRNDAIAYSYQSQHYFGADVFTVGTSQMNTEKFLELVSSNYPDAQSLTNIGTVASNPKYHALYSTPEDLNNVFNSILQTSTNTEINLGPDSYTKDFLTDYFELYGDAADKYGIKAYTADYIGNGKFADRVEFTDAIINVKSSQGNSRLDTVEVSGFDYSANFIAEAALDSSAQGKKLIIEIPVKVRDGFWGGNNVPTNKSESAIYGIESDVPVIRYPEPQVNVTRTPEVVTNDNVIYYDSKIDYEDVLESIVIDGVNVIIGNDGSLTPAETWMDDFADLTWADNSCTSADSIDNKNNKDYLYSVNLTPDSKGTSNNSSNPSNIAGSVMPSEGINGSDVGNVEVLIPQITFEDSTITVGTIPDNDYFNSENLVDIKWVSSLNGEEKTATMPESEPELQLEYTISGTLGDIDTPYYHFKFDTKLDVTIDALYPDGSKSSITDVTNFKWQCDESEHKAEQDIPEHLGSEDSIEFWIHVLSGYAMPDSVVIDYGLPVDIYLMANDLVISDGNPILMGISNENTLESYQTDITCKYGKAEVLETSSAFTAKVRYTPDTMTIDDVDTFWYVIEYTTDDGLRMKYSSTVTVIPATSIYFEDNFVDFEIFDQSNVSEITSDNPHYDDLKWTDEGETVSGVQAEDRPGDYLLETVDADNIYGSDGAYENMSMFSMGSSKLVNVGSHIFDDGEIKTFATASFAFKGTGFDIISVTSHNTGTIVVQISGKTIDGKSVNKAVMVDTYYGYQWSGDSWVVDPDASDALYQIPVMKVADLPYGSYNVKITVTYAELFDHGQYDGSGSFDFYLDAIRIYSPASNGEYNDVIEDAYIADKEGWPLYEELRNILLKAESFGNLEDNEVISGAVFIDNTARDTETGALTPTIKDYLNYGPNNEVYLAPGQAIAFELNRENAASIHLAMKSVGLGTAKVKVFDATVNNEDAALREISTATDLYCDITGLNGKTVVIYNAGSEIDGVLSVTNIKTAYTSDPSEAEPQAMPYRMSRQLAALALNALMPKPEPAPTTEATETEATTEASTEETVTDSPEIFTDPSVEISSSAVATEAEPATSQETTTETSETATSIVTEPSESTSSVAAAPTQTISEITESTEVPVKTVPFESLTTDTTEPECTGTHTESSTTEPTEPSDDILVGDVNLDGKVSIKDVTVIQKYKAKMIELDEVSIKAADVDFNNNVNIKDATAIQKFLAGIIKKFT